MTNIDIIAVSRADICFNVYLYYTHATPKPIKTNLHWTTYHASGEDSESHPSHGVGHVWNGRKAYQRWLSKCPDEE